MRIVYTFQGRERVKDFTNDEVVVGRPKGGVVPDLDLSPDRGVSRRHARFFQRQGAWYVQHIGRVNFIIVDGQRRDDDRPVPIREGSIINLALTPFKVTFDAEPQRSQQWWDE